MKFTKDELADFGINTKKKMSPAKLSKKYELNDYYGHLESPYADKIQAVTSELMLKKNMMNLSKIAFGQEAKKKFGDGVPLAAHPYLVQQGINPLEFTAKMEAITQEEAQMKMMASLPPEQQEQMMMLQQMMAQVDQQPQQQEGNPQGNVGPIEQMAKYGRELSKAQVGGENNNVAYDQTMQDRYTNKWGITLNDNGVGSTTYTDVQGYQDNGLFGGAAENIEGWKLANANYPGMEALLASLPEYGRRKNPEVEKYQKWFNEVSIPEQVAAMRLERERVGGVFTDKAEADAIKSLLEDYGFKKGIGTGYDGLMGTWTSSRRPFTFKDIEEPTTTTTEDPVKIIEQVIPEEFTPPNPEWWKQDQNNLTALGLLDDNLYLPFQPDVQRTTISPTFDDWRGQVNANNAAADQVANQLGAAGGPQAIANSNLAGQLMEANAKAQGSVNTNNINIANQADQTQARLDAQFNQLEANRNVKLYDDTQKVLQSADNFKNWRTGENAKLQNAALTNRANTFNLNTTFDNYAIDPTTGGMIGMTNARGLERTGSVADRESRKQQYFNDITELSEGLGRTPSEAEIAGYLKRIGANQPNDQTTRLAAEAREKGFGGYQTPASKGKEIKKMAVPFYSGKMGG